MLSQIHGSTTDLSATYYAVQSLTDNAYNKKKLYTKTEDRRTGGGELAMVSNSEFVCNIISIYRLVHLMLV